MRLLFKEICYREALIILLIALAVGYINLFPHLAIKAQLDAQTLEYAPYTLGGKYDMANVVGARIHEVLEGNVFISEVDLYEYKNSPAIWPMGSEAYFFPFSFFTTSVTTTVMITDFLFPSFYFILFFFLSYLISGRRIRFSIIAASIVSIYFPLAIHIPPPNLVFVKVIWNTVYPFTSNPLGHLLTLRQSFIPGLLPVLGTYIFLFLTVTKRHPTFPIVGGIFFALNAYTYPFHFLYMTSVFGILFLILLIKRKYTLIKQMLLFAASGIIALIPFIINYFQVISLPQYSDLFSRFGSEEGRYFAFAHWKRYLASMILAWLVWLWGAKTDKKPISYVIIAALLSSITVLNLQLIFGFSVQTDHWLIKDIVWAFTFAYIALASWFVVSILETKGKKWVTTTLILSVIFIGSVALNNFRAATLFAENKHSLYTLSSQKTDVFEWLELNTEAGDVIMTPSLVMNTYIPLYTSNNIFIPRGLNTTASDDEMLERLFITYKVYDIDTEYLDQILLSNDTSLPHFQKKILTSLDDDYYETAGSLYLFSAKYLNEANTELTVKNSKYHITYEVAEAISNQFKEYSCGVTCLVKYRVDYLLLGPQEKKITIIDLSNHPSLELVAHINDTEIYKVLEK